MSPDIAVEVFYIQPIQLDDVTRADLLDEPDLSPKAFGKLNPVWVGWEQLKGSGQLQESGDRLVSESEDWTRVMASARHYSLSTWDHLGLVEKHDLLVNDIKSLSHKLTASLQNDLSIATKLCNASLFVDEFGMFFLVYNLVVTVAPEAKCEKFSSDYGEVTSILRRLLQLKGPSNWHRAIQRSRNT